MNIEHENNPRSIKFYVKKYLQRHQAFFKGKTVIDFPAGNGVTSKILGDLGAKPLPLDLFPEYFSVEGLQCTRANIHDGIPLKKDTAEALICQEGIEHFSHQHGALKEFNRVMKLGGVLLITTPNYSNLYAKLSYMISESEKLNSTMPPNEFDSIWMSQQHVSHEIYFGHIFLIGFQKLRVLAKLSGFKLKAYHYTRTNKASLLLFPFLYPWIVLINWLVYRKNIRKNQDKSDIVQETYKEVFRCSISPTLLLSSGLMVEFVKEKNADDVAQGLRSCHQEFGST